jgi:hypothetical protein
MPLYMYQAAYVADSWAAQLKNPQNRVETVGRAVCEAVAGMKKADAVAKVYKPAR